MKKKGVGNMKILLVNKFLYPKGGAETYVFKLGETLAAHGHEVQYFGLEDARNIVGNKANSYVSSIDFQQGVKKNLGAPLRIIYSAEARRKIRRVLDDFQPDVVHFNNIQFHLTPSIILEVHKYRTQTGRKVRMICTAHDYQLICPSHGLFDAQLNVCEKCLGGNYMHCVRTKCMKASFAKSVLATMDAYLWKWSRAYHYIDAIVCCSRFMKSKLDTQERFASKTIAIHNFVDAVFAKDEEKEGYVLEFGHLSRDKGTNTVLEVARRMPETKFVFAGYGEAEKAIAQTPNAEFVGFKRGGELQTLISKAVVCLCPSEMYENCPFSVIESQMYLTPVIGARIGGIPELIDEGVTGELFEPGNADELEQKLRKVLHTPGLAQTYSQNCRHHAFETADSYYEKLMKVYGG